MHAQWFAPVCSVCLATHPNLIQGKLFETQVLLPGVSHLFWLWATVAAACRQVWFSSTTNGECIFASPEMHLAWFRQNLAKLCLLTNVMLEICMKLWRSQENPVAADAHAMDSAPSAPSFARPCNMNAPHMLSGIIHQYGNHFPKSLQLPYTRGFHRKSASAIACRGSFGRTNVKHERC